MTKKSRLILKRLFVRLLTLLVVISIFYIYFKTGALTIKGYELTGVDDVHKEEVLDEIKEISNRKILYIFPSNRIISFHKKEIRNKIKSILTDTKEVNFSLGLNKKINIEVIKYTPVFNLDGGMAIDSNMESFVPEFINEDLPTLSFSTSSNITKEDLINLDVFYKKVNEVLFSISSISIDDHRDAFLRDKTGSKVIKLNLDTKTEKVWSNLISAIDTDPLKKKIKNEIDNLLYIDLRFGNKVFYKFGSNDIIEAYENASSTEQIQQ